MLCGVGSSFVGPLTCVTVLFLQRLPAVGSLLQQPLLRAGISGGVSVPLIAGLCGASLVLCAIVLVVFMRKRKVRNCVRAHSLPGIVCAQSRVARLSLPSLSSGLFCPEGHRQPTSCNLQVELESRRLKSRTSLRQHHSVAHVPVENPLMRASHLNFQAPRSSARGA